MTALLMIVAFVAGTFNAIEAGANSALRRTIGGPLWSVAIVAAVTLLLSVAIALAIGEKWPGWRQLGAVPWWGWSGGLLGLGFVLAMVTTADALGTALFIALTVTASILSSIAIDHFGLIGMARHPAGVGRIAGGLLMVAGVALVAIF